MGDHVVFPGELLETNRTGVVLNVGFMRGDVMPTEITDVCVGTMADSASINVAFFYTKISHWSFSSLALSLKRALEVALADLRLGADQIEYGTTQVVLWPWLLFRFRIRVLGIISWWRLALETCGAVLFAKAFFEINAYVSRRLCIAARRLLAVWKGKYSIRFSLLLLERKLY